MALVLRKALLSKNISMLKCMKGRPLASTANRKNAPAITTPAPFRGMRRKTRDLALACELKIMNTKWPTAKDTRGACSGDFRTRCCISCPNLVSEVKTIRPSSRKTCHRSRSLHRDYPLTGLVLHNPFSDLFQSHSVLKPCTALMPKRNFASKPSPCCGCGCLPPPCNTPAKCLQYMTGYYYYPYGFWFCGPYHVTGTCCPAGPCCPSSPCSPSCCPGPCPCAKCCACLAPALTAMVGPQTSHKSPPRDPSPPSQTPSAGAPARPVTTPSCDMHFQPFFSNQPTPPSPSQISSRQSSTRFVTKDMKTCKKGHAGVTKIYPFQLSQAVKPKSRKSFVCPYSTKPEFINQQESYPHRRIRLNTTKVRYIDPFPKHPKKHISGCYSRSSSGHKERKRNLAPCLNKVARRSLWTEVRQSSENAKKYSLNHETATFSS